MTTTNIPVHNNSAFLDDEAQPPPYSSIYPAESTNKIYSISSSISAQRESDAQLANQTNAETIRPNLLHNSTNLFQNSPEPISYDELFQCNNNSTRFLIQTPTSPPTPVLLQPWHQHQQRLHNNRANNLIKQLKTNFPRPYLLRHTVFISATSLILISFQIILMTNNAILSNWASGLWCGFGNLFTLAVSFATMSAIMLHVISIMFGVGGLIVVNCVAATKYSYCSYYPTNPGSNYDFSDRYSCSTYNLKYINIAGILLGATCMIMFVTFFFKLINVFNTSQAVNRS